MGRVDDFLHSVPPCYHSEKNISLMEDISHINTHVVPDSKKCEMFNISHFSPANFSSQQEWGGTYAALKIGIKSEEPDFRDFKHSFFRNVT